MQLRPPTDTEAIIANARSIGPIIEEEADKFAKERRLTDDVVALMRRAGLFRIAFPKAWGGPEMDILSQCEVMETLGYHDASAAWVAMICSDSGHYAARIDETEARALYPSLDLLTAGMIAPTGQAITKTASAWSSPAQRPAANPALTSSNIAWSPPTVMSFGSRTAR